MIEITCIDGSDDKDLLNYRHETVSKIHTSAACATTTRQKTCLRKSGSNHRWRTTRGVTTQWAIQRVPQEAIAILAANYQLVANGGANRDSISAK
jgi:hypothetical protein